MKVVDVDGSYLYRKYHSQTELEDLPPPVVPIAGWDVIEDPQSDCVAQIPKITHGK